jgi:hypothetical protein
MSADQAGLRRRSTRDERGSEEIAKIAGIEKQNLEVFTAEARRRGEKARLAADLRR